MMARLLARVFRNRFSWRVAVLAMVLFASTAGIVGRLVWIQVLHHDRYLIAARDEHLEKRLVRSSRGAILDRNGFPLATSVDVYDLYIDQRVWKDNPAQAEYVASKIAPLLGQQTHDMIVRLTSPGDGPIQMLEESLEFDTGREIEKLALPGVVLASATERYYPEGDLASSLLGFLGREHKGLAGVELDMDETLSGTPGALYFERDGGGRPISLGRIQREPGIPGADIRLTIDRYIQRLVETELDFQLKAHSASGGTIVVMDPKTGAILAMASRPSFKLQSLSLQDATFDLYRNRAVSDLYEPGSVFKTLTMATAIDLGLVTPGTTFFDAGYVDKGGYVFKNWDFSAHGTQTMTQLLQKSLNTGAIWLSDLIGPNKLYEYYDRYGIGESSNSGISGEATGIVRTNKDDGWYPSDLATNSYGQGIAATPLQVVTAVSSLINGGKLMRPYIVEAIESPTETRVLEPVVVRQAITPETSATMLKMLNDVVDGVQGHKAQVKGFKVGGKTGTTLVSIPTGYALDSTIASFVGFAPADDPAFILLVKIDQPQDDPLGGVVAAPVFGRLAPSILAYLNVRPDAQLARTAP